MRPYRKYASGQEVYPQLSRVFAPEYGEMPAEVIEKFVAQTFGENVSAEDLEFSFKNFLRSAGQVAQQVLPVAAPIAGAALGTFLGGPAGAMIGGQLGSLAGQLIAPGRPAQPPRAMPPTPALRAMPSIPAGPAMPATAGSPAAAQLLQMIARPEVLQALMGMVMGGAARPNVAIGNTPIPLGAIANALGALANQAAAEYNAVAAGGEAVPRYLLDERGEFLCDPAVPEQRAAVLVQRLNETALQEYWRGDEDEDADDAAEEGPEEDDRYDEMDLIDIANEDWED